MCILKKSKTPRVLVGRQAEIRYTTMSFPALLELTTPVPGFEAEESVGNRLQHGNARGMETLALLFLPRNGKRVIPGPRFEPWWTNHTSLHAKLQIDKSRLLRLIDVRFHITRFTRC